MSGVSSPRSTGDTRPMTDATASWRAWLAVAALALSAFAIVTTELAPIGLLSPLATEFGQNESTTGLVVTAYAWVAALAALLSATLLGRLPRRPLLVSLMMLLALSSTAAALTTHFGTLLGARMLGAVAHGAFWAMIGTLGAQLVPARRIGLATAIIFGGVSVASVLGVPLASLVTQLQGWRSAFTVIAALSLLSAGALAWAVPPLPPSPGVGGAALRAILRQRTFRGIYLATACAITAHFAAFTFVEPLLSGALRMDAGVLSPLLLVFGLAGIAGNGIAGRLIDQHLRGLILLSLVLMSLCVLALGHLPAGSAVVLVGTLLCGWGASVAIVFVGFQSWILREAGPAAMPASALYVAIFNAAIGTGALLGGLALQWTGMRGLWLLVALAVAGSVIPAARIAPAHH